MNMRDMDMNPQIETNQEIDDTEQAEQKMLKLMEQMQQQAAPQEHSTNTGVNTKSNIAMNIPVETDINYWDIDVLPTRYKFYGEGVKLQARPLKVIDVKKLTSINDENADAIVNDIIKKCVRGVDIKELYSADKMYILLWLRANSFRDNKYVVEFNCPKCEQESSYHFDIDNINVDYIDDSYDPDKVVTLSNGDDITFKLLQIKDEIAIESFGIKYGDIFANSGEEIDQELLAISFMINTVNNAPMDDVSRYNYLLNMNPGDFSIVTTHLNNMNVGVKSYMNATCNKCGGESHIGITFHPDFFLPKLRIE